MEKMTITKGQVAPTLCVIWSELKRNIMCVMCYIGINTEIEEVKFDRNNPAFCIEKMNFSDFNEETFSVQNIYYIGSSEGCGCGFGTIKIPESIISEVRANVKEQKEISIKCREYFDYEDTIEQIEETIKENKKFVEDTEKLYSLIYDLIERNNTVEFFGCWAGNEGAKPDEITQIKLRFDKFEIDFEQFWNSNVKMIIKK